MDYFNELLDSYHKLRKRTFKLMFINEQESASEPSNDDKIAYIDEIKRAIEAAFALPPGQSTEGLGNKGNIYIKNVSPTEVTVGGSNLGKSGYRIDSALLQNFDWTTPSSVGQKILGAWVGGKGGEVARGTAQIEAQKKAEEEARLQELENRIGGSLEELRKTEDGEDYDVSEEDLEAIRTIVANIKRSGRSTFDYCQSLGNAVKYRPPATDSKEKSAVEGIERRSLYSVCKNPEIYLAGASRAGLEYQLAMGRTVAIDEETGLAKEPPEMVPLSLGLLESVTDSHAALTDFLNGKGDCNTIDQKIGLYKGKLVLFSNETSEGVVIDRTNSLQKMAGKIMANTCPDVNLSSISNEVFSLRAKNAIKGTFYELTLQLATQINALSNIKDEKERANALKEFTVSMADRIREKKEILEEIASKINPDAAQDFEGSFEREIIEEQLGVSRDNKNLHAFLLSELHAVMPIVQFINADGAIPQGKTGGTGAREDTLFLFNDEKQAKKIAPLVGAEAVYRKDLGQWTIGAGQKRLQEFNHAVKAGEVNTEERRKALNTGTATADHTLDAGFLKKCNTMQFKGDLEMRDRVVNWGTKQDEKIAEVVKHLDNDTSYIDPDGKIKTSKAKSLLRNIADKFKDTLTFDELKKSRIGRALLNSTGNYRDFSDAATRSRAREALEREIRFRMWDKELKKGNSLAKKYIIRQALLCGANTRDQSQIITDDAGKTWVIPHNLFFEKICEKGTTIEISGNTAHIKNGGKTYSQFRQEGTWNSSNTIRHTRSLAEIPKEIIEEEDLMKNITPQLETNSIFYEFLKGQQALLETILNQTKHNVAL